MSDPTNIDNDRVFAEGLSDLMLEDRIAYLNKILFRPPRDRRRAAMRREVRLADAEGMRTAAAARVGEAAGKARRYRRLPVLGRSLALARDAARAGLEVAEADVAWAQFKLEKARQSCRKREEWERDYAHNLAELEALLSERECRQSGLGAAQLREMRKRGRGALGAGQLDEMCEHGAVIAAERMAVARRQVRTAAQLEWSARLHEQGEWT